MKQTVTLLRHGETVGAARFRGRIDEPLSDLGCQQMQQATTEGAWDLIVSSPLCRCRDFAQQLAQQKDLPLQINDDWQEMDFGQWEGKSPADLIQSDPEALERFWSEPDLFTPPEAEPLADFSQRVKNGWAALPTEYERILVVTHGGPIRLSLCAASGTPDKQLLQFNALHAGLTPFSLQQSEAGPILKRLKSA
ncbi:MAG: alpha-ribazole phosphatase family protein [Gammaproteobacteria bacterium]|nr:alpha-ribazole phosphatase family protein [Gammaproteobacteria bacterium]